MLSPARLRRVSSPCLCLRTYLNVVDAVSPSQLFFPAGTLQRSMSCNSMSSPSCLSSTMQDRENGLMATRSETSGIIPGPKTLPDKTQWASEEYAVRSKSCDLLASLQSASTDETSHPSNGSMSFLEIRPTLIHKIT